MATMSLGKALNTGLRRAMEHDPKVVLMGEDIGKLGGVFRVTEGLQRDFGDRRVIDTPLAESGVIGTAVGLALRGYRPVCEIQFDGFIYPAFDQIVSQVAKLHYRNEGRVTVPLTIRVPFGGGVGAVEHHSESPEAYFAHTAGLRVVTPSNAADGYRMIQQAIASDDPVVFFEPKRRYWEKGDVDDDDDDPALTDGPAPPRRSRCAEGSDVTIAAYGPMVATALDAARIAEEEGTSIEVIDLRSLSPVDFDTIEASVRKTGRLVVAHEASVFCGLGAEIAARISERCFFHLEAPVRRVGGFATPYPRLAGRAPLPSRRRPHPPRGGPVPPAVSGARHFVLPDLGEGLTEAERGGLARRRRRRGDPEPGPRRGGDREGRGRAAQPLRRHRRRAARRGGRDGRASGHRSSPSTPRRRTGAPRSRPRTGADAEEKVPMLVGYGPSEAPPSRRRRNGSGHRGTTAARTARRARRRTRPTGDPPAGALAPPGALHGAAERGRPGRRDRPRPGRRSSRARTWPRISPAPRASEARATSRETRAPRSRASRSTWRRPWRAAWPRRPRPASSSRST